MNSEPIKNPGLFWRSGFFMSMQFFFRVPEALLPVYDPVVFYFDALTFEPLLHGSRCFKKLAGTQFPRFVHDTVSRNALFMVAAAHCPPNESCAAFITEICGDRPIGSRASFRDLPHHVINVIKKVISLFHARWRGLLVSRRFRVKAGGTNLPRTRG